MKSGLTCFKCGEALMKRGAREQNQHQGYRKPASEVTRMKPEKDREIKRPLLPAVQPGPHLAFSGSCSGSCAAGLQQQEPAVV